MPYIQHAQKCPWCAQYLLMGEEFAIYNGPDKNYAGWECHANCNLPESPKKRNKKIAVKK
jgi:hypothetical protein